MKTEGSMANTRMSEMSAGSVKETKPAEGSNQVPTIQVDDQKAQGSNEQATSKF